MADNLIAYVRREIARLRKEIDRRTSELASLKGRTTEAPEGLPTSGRPRQEDATEIEKGPRKGKKNRSGELELGAREAP